MNILHLKYAVEVAKTQSISKAADNLYMGQPNLSRAIKELEESLGVTIFKRTSKGIITTPDGDEFLRYARKIVAQVEEVEEIYRAKSSHKQTFSVCVPRAGYISAAMSEFAAKLNTSEPFEIIYKETDSEDTINAVTRGDCTLGIVRFRTAFEKYFEDLFKEKKLAAETVCEYSRFALIRADEALASKKSLSCGDLRDYIEITHGDYYVPTVPVADIRRAELSEGIEKRIFVYDRAARLELLVALPKSFMWVSPVPLSILDRYGLAMIPCSDSAKVYKDVLIHRRGYKLSDIDKRFITEIINSKHNCFKGY